MTVDIEIDCIDALYQLNRLAFVLGASDDVYMDVKGEWKE